jgi:hypothetical protein
MMLMHWDYLQSIWLHLLDLMHAWGIYNWFQNTRVWPRNKNFIRPNPDFRYFLVPGSLQSSHELIGKHLLAQVVAAFDNDRQQLPVFEVTVRRGITDLAFFFCEGFF